MNLTAFRYRVTGEKDFRTWRFSLGVGPLRNFVAFHVPSEQLTDVTNALEYALTGRQYPRIAETAIQLADAGGEAWIIQRAGRQIRYLRNNEPITPSEAQSSMIAALLDDFVDGASNRNPNGGFCGRPQRLLQSTRAGQRLCTDDTSGIESLDEVAQELQEISNACSDLMSQKDFKRPEQIIKFAEKIRSITDRYIECRDHLKELGGSDEQTAKRENLPPARTTGGVDDLKRIEQLGPELEILGQMAETAAPLLDPAQNITILKEALDRIEVELAEILAAFGLDAPPGEMRDWRKPLDALCRYQTLKQLYTVSEVAAKRVREKMEPAWRDYFSLLEAAVSRDLDLTAELESCVTSLQVRAREAERRLVAARTDQEKRRSFMSRWAPNWRRSGVKIAAEGPIATSPAQSGQMPSNQDPVSPESRLESGRLALELSINRLGVLRAQLDHLRSEHQETQTDILETHDRLAVDYSRAKERWLGIAQEYKLPEDMALTSLSALVSRYTSIFALTEERNSLRNRIRDRRTRLARLESLIAAWRQHTGSQRGVELSNSQLILTEARSILRYRAEKQDLYSKLQQSLDQNRTTISIKSSLESRRTRLLAEWKRAFTELGLTPLRIGDSKLQRLFEHAATLQGCLTLQNRLLRHLPANLFAGNNQSSEQQPIRVFYVAEAEISAEFRDTLIRQMEDAKADGLHIVVSTAPGLADFVALRGAGRSHYAEAKTTNEVSTGPSAPVIRAPQRSMSDRAKAALDVLTTRRT